MPASVNKVFLLGNMTRDPELRYTPKGTAVVTVGMAMNHSWKDEGGNVREEVTFVDCTAFGRTAEIISQYCKKGKPVHIEGRLKLDQWDDKQTNQKRQKLSVVISEIQFLNESSGPHEGGGQRERPAFQSNLKSGRTAPPPPADDQPPEAEDDVPFHHIPPARLQALMLGHGGNKLR